MNSNQQNQASNKDSGSGVNPTADQSMQRNMGMNPGMPTQPMGFQPGMMNFGAPNFMQHLASMGGMPGGQMPGAMYQAYPGMMNQPNLKQEIQNKVPPGMNPAKDNYSMGQTDLKNIEGSKDRQVKSEDMKDQSKLQGEAKNAQIEKRTNSADKGDINEMSGKQDDPNKKPKGQDGENRDNQRNEDKVKKMEPEGEDDDGKYNLRKRTRKENPYYYCELSDGEEGGKGEGGRKRQKKYEEDYDPNQDQSSHEKYTEKQANQSNMNQNLDVNSMNNQMMMHQMARGNQPGMMNMPNLNDAASALNPMMSGYMNPMMAGMGMRPDQMGVSPMSQNYSQMQTQMSQNDPKQVSIKMIKLVMNL